MRVVTRFVLSVLLLSLFITPRAEAQYFGRNKVQWENFDFKVLQTEHFDIYYYEQEADVVQDIARMSERWYARLSRVPPLRHAGDVLHHVRFLLVVVDVEVLGLEHLEIEVL